MGHYSRLVYRPDPSEVPNHPTMEELSDAQYVAKLLETDDATAQRLLRLMDGLEDHREFPAPPLVVEELLPAWGQEGFADVATALWERIRQWVKSVIRWVMDDETQTHHLAKLAKYQLETLKLETQSRLPTNPPQGTLRLNSHIPYLTVRYRPLRDVGALTSRLRQLRQLMQAYGQYQAKLTTGMERISQLVRVIHPEQSDLRQFESLEALALAISPIQTRRELGLLTEAGWNWIGEHLLGNQRLTLMNATGPVEDLKALNRVKMRLQHSEASPKPLPDVVEFPRFARHSSGNCLDEAIALCTEIIERTSAENRSRRKRAMEGLVAALDRMNDSLSEIPAGQSERKEYIQQLIRLGETLTDWCNNPYQGLTGLSMRALKATRFVCRTNAGL